MRWIDARALLDPRLIAFATSILLLTLNACTTKPPARQDDLCAIFAEKGRWYKHAKAAEDKWGLPIPVGMAFIYKESSFQSDARPERDKLFWVIPWTRPSSAYGYAQATNDAWKDYRRTGEQSLYVGYSPIVVVDAEKIVTDLPGAHVLHIVRNPWSAYADTKKRPVPLSLSNYLLAWTLNQYHALQCRELYPGRVHILRLEDILESGPL